MHLSTGIRVCDSPGLVFPSIIDKNIQILSGLYNIAQIKDPYGPVLYLSKRIDLFKKLSISRSQEPEQFNSIFYICEEYAKKCGFFTSKAGRPDSYRAANFILRQVIDGKILLFWTPPGFEEELHQISVPVKYYEIMPSGSSDNESPSSESEGEDEVDVFKSFGIKSRFSVLNEFSE